MLFRSKTKKKLAARKQKAVKKRQKRNKKQTITERKQRSAATKPRPDTRIVLTGRMVMCRKIETVTMPANGITGRKKTAEAAAWKMRMECLQILRSLTVAKRQTVFWKCFRMVMDLSDAKIIFPVKMISMFLRHRSVDLI